MADMRRRKVGDAMGLLRKCRLGHCGLSMERLELDGSWAAVYGDSEEDVGGTAVRRFAAEQDGSCC